LRLVNLLLIGTLALLVLWWVGQATRQQHRAYHYQANTMRNRPVLSLIFLGRQVMRRAVGGIPQQHLRQAIRSLQHQLVEMQCGIISWGALRVYHINAVDEVTQFQVVCTVEKISEAYLLHALEQLLQAFPFPIQGFHSDNGSEYINGRVAALLLKLVIEFTKSRARQTNDHALVESKNGAVVRKLFGHAHIPQRWATLINAFNQAHLNPYLNFHRPCFFPEIRTDQKGKARKSSAMKR
jgi:transposase InsO family protein